MKQTAPYHDPILDWHVAQCIKGDELKVADKIQSRGGETAVPMGKGRDHWKRGRKSEGKEFAVLEGYVPYRGVRPQKSDGVVHVLDGLISDKVMQEIMARYIAGDFNEAKKAIDAALKMAGKMVNVDHRTLGKFKAKIVRVLPDNRFEISFEARSGYVKGEVGMNEIIL